MPKTQLLSKTKPSTLFELVDLYGMPVKKNKLYRICGSNHDCTVVSIVAPQTTNMGIIVKNGRIVIRHHFGFEMTCFPSVIGAIFQRKC